MSEADTDLELNAEVQTPAAPEPKTPEPAKPETVSDPTGLRSTLTKAFRESAAKEAEKLAAKPQPDVKLDGERARGADGKFLPKDATPAPKAVETPKADVKPSEGAQPGADQVKKPDAAPGTWRAEAKAKWEALDPVIKAEVLKRESDQTREVTKFQQQIQQINQAYTPIEQVIGPKRAAWRAQFGSEGEALKRLINLSDFAGSDPNGFLSYFLSQPDVAGRVDLQKVFGVQGGEPSLQDKTFQNMQTEIAGLKQQLTGFLGQQQSQHALTIEQQIADFASAKATDGTPLRPHFDSVREDVFNLIPAMKAQFPNLSVQQIMDKAYSVAIHSNETVAGEIRKIEEERIRSEVEKADRAKKAQLANKSLPPGAPAGDGARAPSTSDLRSELVRNMRAFREGSQPRL